MLCERCKKNQATKAYEQITNGKKAVGYYCLECYQNLFLFVEEQDAPKQSVCSYCGTSVSEIKKRNLVGCAYCYQTLSSALTPIVIKMQGVEVHKGKPLYESEQERVEHRSYELKTLSKKSYAENDFERAREYERQIVLLKSGDEEEYEWRNRNLSKRS